MISLFSLLLTGRSGTISGLEEFLRSLGVETNQVANGSLVYDVKLC